MVLYTMSGGDTPGKEDLKMRAQQILKGMTIEQLLGQWELTTDNNDENISIVRGWLMDEIESRNPEGFDAWLDDEDSTDENLRKYILA